MKTITLSKAKLNFADIIKSILINQEETTIATDEGAVVMINEDNWNSINETLRLLKDKKSLKALLLGHQQREQNQVEGKTIKNIFYDL